MYPNFTKVLKCMHKNLPRRQIRTGAWSKKNSVTFKALFEKLTRKKLADDMKHCASFLHTGALENYHNVRLKYLPTFNPLFFF